MGRKEDLDSLGGSDGIEKDSTDVRTCDKRDHLIRSTVHQPNHFRHWQGRSNILGPQLERPDPETPGRLFEGWLASHLPIIKSRDHKGES